MIFENLIQTETTNACVTFSQGHTSRLRKKKNGLCKNGGHTEECAGVRCVRLEVNCVATRCKVFDLIFEELLLTRMGTLCIYFVFISVF